MQSRSLRKETAAPARLVAKDGTVYIGTVKNVSLGGVKIQVEDDAVVPAEFRLESAELQIKSEAAVVWRLGTLIGVRLVDAVVAAPPPIERRPMAASLPFGLGSLGVRRRGVGA
jgi:hypothetical protein